MSSQDAWAPGPGEKWVCGRYTPPRGNPIFSRGPSHLLLSQGPPPSHPSFFVERTNRKLCPSQALGLPELWLRGVPLPYFPKSRPSRGSPGRQITALPPVWAAGQEGADSLGVSLPPGARGWRPICAHGSGGAPAHAGWEVTDLPFVSLSPGLRLQPGRA